MTFKELAEKSFNLLLENASSIDVDTSNIRYGKHNEVPTGEQISLNYFIKPLKNTHYVDGKRKKSKNALINIFAIKQSNDPTDLITLFDIGDTILSLFEESQEIKCQEGNCEFDGIIDSLMIVNIEITAIYGV